MTVERREKQREGEVKKVSRGATLGRKTGRKSTHDLLADMEVVAWWGGTRRGAGVWLEEAAVLWWFRV